MGSFLEQYETLDIIGNGSFGIIRKVKRKSDGHVFARKELNFEKMTERDRKQIVAEVNILKELHHDHIVRYYDRYVDREAGILYIVMEYCGGGDLSSIIRQSQRHNRPIPEDTIWNYFMQLLLALQHCHHPSSSSRGGNTAGGECDGKEKRSQILHRDLKPDNVFLDEANRIKLGDFGLSKALSQSSFANTYVGTPYYMSPELTQGKAYDSKSDIWSLGCLIYELCALKPPFAEAKTQSELSAFIRSGRIPSLPREYSQSLWTVIKAMLNLNPAMRPSANQLLQHERLELAVKVSETEQMLTTVKNHRAAIVSKEREVATREAAVAEREARLATAVAEKEAEVRRLEEQLTHLSQQAQQAAAAAQQQQAPPESVIEERIREAIAKREEELRVAVIKREEEVARAIARREEEIMEAVRKREADVCEAWMKREEQIRVEMAQTMEERTGWIQQRERDMQAEREEFEKVRKDLEERVRAMGDSNRKGQKEKTPLEEVKNLLVPFNQLTDEHSRVATIQPKPDVPTHDVKTPVPQHRTLARDMPMPASAMKGVVLTSTGQPLSTPTPAELANLFVNSPRVGLDFGKIFEFESDPETDEERDGDEGLGDDDDLPPSPSKRPNPLDADTTIHAPVHVPALGRRRSRDPSPALSASQRPMRMHRPSLVRGGASGSGTGTGTGSGTGSGSRRTFTRAATMPASSSEPISIAPNPSAAAQSASASTRVSRSVNGAKRPVSATITASVSATTVSASAKGSTAGASSQPAPEYDLSDEENLPSPFLKRVERERGMPAPSHSQRETSTASARTGSGAQGVKKRASNGHLLRAVAAANSAAISSRPVKNSVSTGSSSATTRAAGAGSRPVSSLVTTRKASEETRKMALRS
ncbi:kinase-like protein [Coniophora puteana RWD-64-598 SS2]|uniref:non-specific serine/threonine protein kinase n=1 Tax=Coniophora puteana (strain RWD-64-598) TaxID=741705 RepID=R7SCW3_CONPW|nr:kinase-like protein [Coniophora puteana RWD-64-598 SS2]EIW74003.1 kinase-like protein [Coniophora puteana RWD-64-598 SS2]